MTAPGAPKSDFVDRLTLLIGDKTAYVYLVSVAVIAYEVVARYLFGAPTIWAHESTITLTAIGFVVGGAYALQRDEHIRITVVYDLLPERVRRVLDLLNALLVVGYAALLLYAAAIVALRAWSVMETSASAWNQPVPVVLKTALAFGAALLLLQGAAQLVRRARRGRPTRARSG